MGKGRAAKTSAPESRDPLEIAREIVQSIADTLDQPPEYSPEVKRAIVAQIRPGLSAHWFGEAELPPDQRAREILTRLFDAANEIDGVVSALDAEEGRIMDESAVRRLQRVKSGLFDFIEEHVDLLDATPADLPWTQASLAKEGA